jgi:hypothetical protein
MGKGTIRLGLLAVALLWASWWGWVWVFELWQATASP